MKNLSKILALTLSLFLLLPIAIGAAGNPDRIPGSLQYFDTSFYVGSSGHNYFAILPGHTGTNGGGFGSSNPIGMGKVGGLWPSVKTLPLFELLAYDRTSGSFNPGKLVSLTPDGMQYPFPDGGHGFSYSTTGATKQGAWEAFYAEPSEKYSPVVSFTAPFEGKFELSITIQRKNNTLSGDSNRPYSDKTGMQLRYYKNNSLIYRETINTNASQTITVQEMLKKGDVLYIEFDPVYNNIKDDEFFVRDLRAYALTHYDGVIDAEYDNSEETPLLSIGLISDVHADMDQILDDTPTYNNYPKMLEDLKARGDIDAILIGGDILSDNYYWGNDPLFKYSYWTNERVEHTISYIFDEALEATEGGNGLVLGVAGNHDKDAGVVAAHDKVTNECGKIEEVNSADYYPYFAQEAMKTLRFNDMGEEFHSPFNEVVCYRYNVGGLEIIGITQTYQTIKNLPYTGYGCPLNGLDDDYGTTGSHRNGEKVWKEQAQWVAQQLDEIGTEKTVIVLCHYNMTAGAMTYDGAADVLLESFEKHPNVIYTYGHCHGSNDRSETWYNTIEHVETLGNRVQLKDGSYATDSWQYLYIGSVRFGTNATSGNQDSPVAQYMTMDIYNDHITFQTHNVGSDYPVGGVEVPSSYTIKREMSQIDGYTGNGSGNVTIPEAPVSTEALQHIPTAVSNVKKQFIMDLGLGKLTNGQFSIKGILELTNAKLSLTPKAEPTTWSDAYLQHNYAGNVLVQTTQSKNGMFDIRAAIGYSAAMIFTAPETGAFKYEVDMTKLWGGSSNGQSEIKVMKGGGILLTSYTPENKSNAKIVLTGYVYLEEGEELRIIVAQSKNSSTLQANEIAVNSFIIKQYDSYTLPEAESDNNGGGNTSVGVCIHKGGEATCCTLAVCEECGEEYGSYNIHKHASNEYVTTITDSTHKSVYACCGKIKIAEGHHAFANGKCKVCEYECDHDGYVDDDGKCENCGLTDIVIEKDSGDSEKGIPQIVIYIVIAIVALALGMAFALLITKRSLKK